MSLFSQRQWWRSSCGSQEDFTGSSLCVGNLEQAPDGTDKVATASLQGVVRIHKPAQRGIGVEDLLLEVHLGQPVLQLEAGQFMGGSGAQLAVLHPYSLALYAVTQAAGQSGGLEMQPQLTFQLAHTAANMVVGHFGHLSVQSGGDHLCVQSMDGQLSFFAGGTCVFDCFLPGFLVPGPLCCCPAIDTLVTTTSSLGVQGFKFSSLAAGAGHAQASAGPGSASVRMQSDWTYVMGEEASCITFAKYLTGQDDADEQVVVVGERSITCLDGRGLPHLHKRLDFTPTAHTLLPGTGGTPARLLLAAPSGQLAVFAGAHLVWLTQLGHPVSALGIGTFGPTRGLLVGLGASGELSVTYMGTRLAAAHPALSRAVDPDYMAMEKQHRQLKAALRTVKDSIPPSMVDELTIGMQVSSPPGELGKMAGPAPSQDAEGLQAALLLVVSYAGSMPLAQLHLSIQSPGALRCDQASLVVPVVQGGMQQPVLLPITCQLASMDLCNNHTFDVTGSYTDHAGNMRSVVASLRLPLGTFCQLVGPVHTATCRITLTTNQPPMPLTSLFADIVTNNQDAALGAGNAANVITLQCWASNKVTVLVSKTAGRYRVQADSFEALGCIVEELIWRLCQAGMANSSFKVSCEDAMPLEHLHDLTSGHQHAQEQATATAQRLTMSATQLRAVQKRLLLAAADRHPARVDHLQLLLHETGQQLRDLGRLMTVCQQAVDMAHQRIAAACRLLAMLACPRLAGHPLQAQRLTAQLAAQACALSREAWEQSFQTACELSLEGGL